MIKIQLLLLLLVMSSYVQTGVYVLAELQKEIVELIQETQDVLSKQVAILNEQDSADYIFQNAQFLPHLSLAFVSQEELTIQEVKQKFPDLVEDLQDIADKHSCIDLSKEFEGAVIDYWSGTYEVECGGLKKKNYFNVVLKVNNNRSFAELAQAISKILEDKYNVKQRFSLIIHITLGRICDKNDNPIDTSLKQKLAAIAISPEERTTAPKSTPILIEEFKLKGHDGSEEKFALLAKN